MIPRALIWLLLIGFGVALALLLGACGTLQTLKGSGTPAEPPIGYVVDCAKNPAQAHCTP